MNTPPLTDFTLPTTKLLLSAVLTSLAAAAGWTIVTLLGPWDSTTTLVGLLGRLQVRRGKHGCCLIRAEAGDTSVLLLALDLVVVLPLLFTTEDIHNSPGEIRYSRSDLCSAVRALASCCCFPSASLVGHPSAAVAGSTAVRSVCI